MLAKHFFYLLYLQKISMIAYDSLAFRKFSNRKIFKIWYLQIANHPSKEESS